MHSIPRKVVAVDPRQVKELVRRTPCLQLAADLAAPQGLLIAPWRREEVASCSKLASTRADCPHPPSQLEVVAPVLNSGIPPWVKVFAELHELQTSSFSDAPLQSGPGSPSLARESPSPPARSPSMCPILPHVIWSFGCSRTGPSVLGRVKAWVWTPPRLQS